MAQVTAAVRAALWRISQRLPVYTHELYELEREGLIERTADEYPRLTAAGRLALGQE